MEPANQSSREHSKGQISNLTEKLTPFESKLGEDQAKLADETTVFTAENDTNSQCKRKDTLKVLGSAALQFRLRKSVGILWVTVER